MARLEMRPWGYETPRQLVAYDYCHRWGLPGEDGMAWYLPGQPGKGLGQEWGTVDSKAHPGYCPSPALLGLE